MSSFLCFLVSASKFALQPIANFLKYLDLSCQLSIAVLFPLGKAQALATKLLNSGLVSHYFSNLKLLFLVFDQTQIFK
jgi:hypothetical protein